MSGFGTRDRALALALAGGLTVRDAAEQAGCSEQTAFRRLESADFRALVTKTRSELFERAMGRLAAAAGTAAGTLAELSEAGTDAVRLQAARTILDAGMKWRDAQEFEARVTVYCCRSV